MTDGTGGIVDSVIDDRGNLITLNVLGLSDLKTFLKVSEKLEPGSAKSIFNGRYTNDTIHYYIANRVNIPLYDGITNPNSDNIKRYADYYKYRSTAIKYDKFINEIVNKNDSEEERKHDDGENGNEKLTYHEMCIKYDINFNLDLYYNYRNNNIYQFNSKKDFNALEENEKSYTHSTGEYFRINAITSEEEIENLENYIIRLRSELEQINGRDDRYLHAKIYTLLTNDIRDFLRVNGMSARELFALYEVFSKLEDEVSTYQPYITEVTHHWFKDLDFKDAYDEMDLSSRPVTHQINPEGEARIAEFDELEGKIMNTMTAETGKKGKVQNRQPKIITTEPWHFKVKAWMQYGYYFIYDGTTETAKEIERAKLRLASEGYDSENPLLLESLNDSDYENLYKSQIRKEEIDNRAAELNQILEDENFNVRLKQISFEKNTALQAFAILEAMHTEDSEYIYRDLKEFLIELNYFTRADFESIETGVLQWIIPAYTVYKDEWPDIKYEKNSTQYGSYVRSSTLLEKQRVKEHEENLNTENDTPTYIDDHNEYSPHLADRGYQTVTRVGSVFYKNYKQWASAYSDKTFSQGNMRSSGCGPTSTAVMLSAYYPDRDDLGPYDVAQFIMQKHPSNTEQTGSAVLEEALEDKNVTVNRYSVDNTNAVNNIRQALLAGKPVLLGTTMSSFGHWICAIDISSDGQTIIISNPSCGDQNGNDPDIQQYNITNFVNTYMATNCTYIIPEKAPTGLSLSTKYEIKGFDADLPVVMPENGIIEKIVTEPEKENTEDDSSATNSEGQQPDEESSTEEDDETFEQKMKNKQEFFKTNGQYVIIKFQTGNGMNNWKMKIEGFTIDSIAISEGSIYNKNTVLGTTTLDSNVKIILFDEKGAIVDNVQDYFKLKSRKKMGSSNLGELEDIIEFIWKDEGGPKEGNNYIVLNFVPFDKTKEQMGYKDRETVGHGVTPATWETWVELGYGEYICDKEDGKGFVTDRIPVDIVDEISKYDIEKRAKKVEDSLKKYGVTTFGSDQKNAILSLAYNLGEGYIDIFIEKYKNEGTNALIELILSCWHSEDDDTNGPGLRKRRIEEVEIFLHGNYNLSTEDMKTLHRQYYGYDY